MKNLIWILSTLILVSFSNTSCKKPEKTGFKLLVIELTEEDKSLVNYYYENPTITFLGDDNQELVFKNDTLYYEQIGDLKLNYNCISQDMQGCSLQISLSRIPDSILRLTIVFEHDQDWSSGFYERYITFPNSHTSFDTTYESGYRLKFDYYDSLLIRSEQFYNVFHILNQEESLYDMQTLECYYTNKNGVVAFKTLGDILWIRKIE